ncbi:MAG: MBL fold metallo-hydrolase [Alphaproteobacteria bacterium]|nr:MBL fold metallo-hydrolase [Alphaproteobacteria bacterium]
MQKENNGTSIEFLGGNNEYRIGANSIMIEHTEKGKEVKRIILDIGALFPPDWVHYDAAIPDMAKYFENPYSEVEKPIDGLFITHCHEDHIGALVYLAAAKYKLPNEYSSGFTRDFILSQMQKNNIPTEFIPNSVAIRQGNTVNITDNFKISPFNVSHSTAGALGFHVLTTENGKNLFGGVFSGDYHLGKVPFGEGFDKEAYKEFISDKFVSHIFVDSTSATMSADNVVTFDQAVENTVREVKKHPEKQVFSAVIARSVQNLAIDLKAAKETGRTVLIDGKGLRQTFNILQSRVRGNDPKLLEIFGIEDGKNFDFNDFVYKADNVESADVYKYLEKYSPSERYMIISGAFAEDKEGRKSSLVLMSEQNKVSYDGNGKVKGKGLSGHPIFTVDSNTLFMLRQRPIESINGDKHRAMVNRLLALGPVVVLNGDTPDTKYQRTGHANKSETEEFIKLTIENCANSKDLLSGKQKVHIVAIHGDVEQLKANEENFKNEQTETMLCMNSDKITVTPEGCEKISGKSFDEQKWICVEASSSTGFGYNDIFVFDLCDKNFVKIDNLYTVVNVNVKAGRRAVKENIYQINKALDKAYELEEQGISASNIEIRRQIRGGKKGHMVESYSYSEIKNLRDNKSKSKNKGKFNRQGGKGRGGR